MHYADWVLREGTALHWHDVRRPIYQRAIAYRPNKRALKNWQNQYARMVTQPVFYACKGPNPVLARTCRENIGLKHAGFYYDSGDWSIDDSPVAVMLAEIAHGPGDLYVTRTEDVAKLVGDGVSGLIVEPGPGRVWFSRATPLLNTKTGAPAPEASHVYRFDAETRYIPADRRGPGEWAWAREGFIYREPKAYVTGDFYVMEPPTAPTPGAFRALLQPMPRRLLAKMTEASSGAPAPDKSMTLEITLRSGDAWRLTDARGRKITPTQTRRKGDRIIVEIAGREQVALTLTARR
jgi:hypothetical protein